MEQAFDLQKEIARYREELLRLAARRRAGEIPQGPDGPFEGEETAAGEGEETAFTSNEAAPEWNEPVSEPVEGEGAEAFLMPQAPMEQENPFQEKDERTPCPDLEKPAAGEKAPCGVLRIRVSAARGLQPVEDALVTVSQIAGEAETLLHVLHTGGDGHAPDCEIPIPADGHQDGKPSCTYCHIRVDKPGFFICHAYRVPVHEGETSLQCARLIPLPTHYQGKRESGKEEGERDGQ